MKINYRKIIRLCFDFIIYLVIGLISFSVAFIILDKDDKTKETVNETFTGKETSLKDSVYTAIFNTRIEHPDIVFAQAILESGHMKTALFREGHNLFGMKVPSKRPTLAVGVLYGHARFNSWMDSVKDYAIWQSIYCKGLTRDEYFTYLDKVYSENKDYVKILKSIIKRVNEFNTRESMSCIERDGLIDTLKI